MKNLFVVCGPTCVGKTSISLHLAQYLDVPIINADSRQLFAEIPIGTAAPTQEEQQLVKHYFVGTLHLNDYYSASKYECDVLNLLTPPGELNHYENALMSGGSMMYIDAVCNGIDDIPTIDEETRDTLRQRLETEGLDPLIEELRLLDPEYFKIVDRRNTRRVVHALEICYMTGKTYTSFRVNEHKHRDFSIVKIGLTRPREELYSRINERVDLMMEQGLEEEARAVYCHKGANSLNTVGYRELFDYIEGKYTLPEAVERIKGATRRYCRKQLTWLKRDPSIKWFHPDERDAIISYIDTNR